MRHDAAWRCASCETLNLPVAESCRRCGAPRSAVRARPRRPDHAGLAAALSLLLPGAGQLYTGQIARALVIILLPTAVALTVAVLLALLDPLLAVALRVAVGLTAAATVTLAVYHGAIVLDAFAAPSTAGLGLRGKRRADYVVLAIALVSLGVGYVTLYRQTTAMASIASRVFAPFQASFGFRSNAPGWSGRERLNVLLLGIDTRRGNEAETQNTDTIIVLSLDPLSRAAAMLSIPRDTLVPIPGHGEDKINAAFAVGGPELARRTVSAFLGAPLHAYALVDFVGFRRIVDSLGGVIVDVPLPVRDEAFPTEDFGVTRVHIRSGPQLMDGETALRYARSRHGSNDFDRAERQQRVLAALQRRMRETRMFLRLPAMADELGDAVRTDLDPANALPLARLAGELDLADIERAVLRPPDERGPGQLKELNSPAGYYLVPVEGAVKRLVAELFYDPRVRAEAARVEIRAPPARAEAARALAEDLSRRRYQVVRVATVPERPRTLVIARNPAKRYTAEQLSRAVGTTVSDGGVDADADVVLFVGDDFKGLDAR